MNKRYIYPQKDFNKYKVKFSQAVIYGNFVFISGQGPLDLETGEVSKGDVETQTRCVFRNITKFLEEAGSSLEKVLKLTIYASDGKHYQIINKVYNEFFSGNLPARTFVAVGPFPLGFDVEVDCIAHT